MFAGSRRFAGFLLAALGFGMALPASLAAQGDLLVYPQGKDEPAFVARGLGDYPEISSRHSEFAVSPEQAAAMRGPVKVELREPVARGGALVASVDTVLR